MMLLKRQLRNIHSIPKLIVQRKKIGKQVQVDDDNREVIVKAERKAIARCSKKVRVCFKKITFVQR